MALQISRAQPSSRPRAVYAGLASVLAQLILLLTTFRKLIFPPGEYLNAFEYGDDFARNRNLRLLSKQGPRSLYNWYPKLGPAAVR